MLRIECGGDSARATDIGILVRDVLRTRNGGLLAAAKSNSGERQADSLCPNPNEEGSCSQATHNLQDVMGERDDEIDKDIG